jgi:hypothetical protein
MSAGTAGAAALADMAERRGTEAPKREENREGERAGEKGLGERESQQGESIAAPLVRVVSVCENV